MKVKFKRRFFGPNGIRYRPGVWYDNVPDSWGEERNDSNSKKKRPRILPKDVEIDNSAPTPAPAEDGSALARKLQETEIDEAKKAQGSLKL